MLDVKFIRENLALVEKSTKEKGYKIDVDEVVRLDGERKKILVLVEELRARRNEIAGKMKGGKPAPELIEEGKKIKAELAELEEKLSEVEGRLSTMVKAVPNVIFDDVPLGGEECGVKITLLEWIIWIMR